MSDIQSTTARPQHQVHDSSDPLPGARGAPTAPDYSAGNMERLSSSAWKDTGAHDDSSRLDNQIERSRSQQGENAFNSDRPLDVNEAPEGGVAIGGQSDLPEGKAGFMDKAIGKTQKVFGKATKNPEMHEKGELREAGGKAAATGDARAPHD